MDVVMFYMLASLLVRPARPPSDRFDGLVSFLFALFCFGFRNVKIVMSFYHEVTQLRRSTSLQRQSHANTTFSSSQNPPHRIHEPLCLSNNHHPIAYLTIT